MSDRSAPACTQNLSFRPPTIDDVDALHALYQDADIRRYLGGSDQREATVRQLKRHLSDWEKNGFGLLLIIDRSTAMLIGVCKLQKSPLEAPLHVEIVYGLLAAWRRMKIGQEAVRAVVAWGFSAAETDRIVARVEPDNKASAATLRRAGFQRRLEDRRVPLTNETEHVYVAWNETFAN